MISSIIELPNFHGLIDDVYGCSSVVNEGSSSYPENLDLVDGRHLSMGRLSAKIYPKYPYKYRMDLVDGRGGYSHIFLISIGHFDPRTFLDENKQPTRVYPIYGKVRGKYVLFIDRINEFFKDTECIVAPQSFNGSTVMSTMDYVTTAQTAIESMPMRNASIAYDCSYVVRDDPYEDILNIALSNISSAENHVGVLNAYGVLLGLMSPEIQMIYKFLKSSDDLRRFDSPLRRSRSDVQIAVEAALPFWPDIDRQLHVEDRIFKQSTDSRVPHSLDGLGFMEKTLNAIYQMDVEDFWFDIRPDPKDISDFYIKKINPYTGFSKVTSRMTSWSDLIFDLIYATDLIGRFPDTLMMAHRSCLEDLTIYDKTTNQILLYIDLVWWVLAAAPGLINVYNTRHF